MQQHYKFYVGIDPGVHTGICVWSREQQQIVRLECVQLHAAMEFIKTFNDNSSDPFYFLVRVEDARKRYWFGETGTEKWQGAGSIKRDCQIWEGFLTDMGVPFEMVAPRNNLTKLTRMAFGNITGYRAPSNEHERAAAMLVYGM